MLDPIYEECGVIVAAAYLGPDSQSTGEPAPDVAKYLARDAARHPKPWSISSWYCQL